MTLWQLGLFGQGGVDPTTVDAQGFSRLLVSVVHISLELVGGVVFIFLLWASIQYIIAGSNPSEQAKAKTAIQSALIGLVIAILAFTLTGTLLRQLQFNATINDNGTLGPIREVILDQTR